MHNSDTRPLGEPYQDPDTLLRYVRSRSLCRALVASSDTSHGWNPCDMLLFQGGESFWRISPFGLVLKVALTLGSSSKSQGVA